MCYVKMQSMRKPFGKRIITLMVLSLLAICLLFVGCGQDGPSIPVPTNIAIDTETGVLSWDEVDGAFEYTVKIDEEEFVCLEPSFELPIYDYLDHMVTVCVTTRDGKGAYASAVLYHRQEKTNLLPQLAVPRNIKMTSYRLMWDPVANNNGYKIFFNGKTFTAAKNATYYDLDLSKTTNGSYQVKMQTVGDGITYASSNISASYDLRVTDHNGPIRNLPKTELTFNPEDKTLEWVNLYSASTVAYEIYINGSSSAVAVMDADETLTKMNYFPVLNGTSRVTYTLRLVSKTGLYSPSDPSDGITFPIADAAPAGLVAAADEEKDGYYLSWTESAFTDGYVVEIDGAPYEPVTDSCLRIPSSLAAGVHFARVKTYGNSSYYADSFYSASLSFRMDASGRLVLTESGAEYPTVDQTTDGIVVTVMQNPDADYYRYTFKGKSGTFITQAEENTLRVTPSTLNGRAATASELSAIEALLSDLATGIVVSVSAEHTSALYPAGLSSEEVFICTDTSVVYTGAPVNFRYTAQGFAWERIEGIDNYELDLDGVITTVESNASIPAIEEGTHTARIRVKGQNTLWSRTIFFSVPEVLDPPTDLDVSSSILSFKGSEHAVGYLLYVEGMAEPISIRLNEQRLDLSSYIDQDREYLLKMVALGDQISYADSGFSAEYLYVKTDAAYGTESKPFEPASAAELWSVMRNNPTAHILLTAAGDYDFSDFDFSLTEPFTFRGVLRGNSRTLTGATPNGPLFAALSEATIRDLTVEITVAGDSLYQEGLFTHRAEKTKIENCVFVLKGELNLSGEVSLGLIFFEAEDCLLTDVTVRCDDLQIRNERGAVLCGVAYRYDGGEIKRLHFQGGLLLATTTLRFVGVAVEGELLVNGLTSALNCDLQGSERTSYYGVTLRGELTASALSPDFDATIKAPIVEYYGVSPSGASLSDCELKGKVTVSEAVNVTMYGVGESMLNANRVTVKTKMKANTSESLRAAGIVNELTQSVLAQALAEDLSDEALSQLLVFAGSIESQAAETTAASVLSASGNLVLSSSGLISVKGGTALLAGGVLYAENLRLFAQSSEIALENVSFSRVGGAVFSAQGQVHVQGSVTVSAQDCGEVYYGGVIARGDADLTIDGYLVSGSIESERASVAGVGYDTANVTLQKTDLTVSLALTAQTLEAAGAVIKATSLTLGEQTQQLNASIRATGEGSVAGFGLTLTSLALNDITLTGKLSLCGTGSVYGVSEEAGAAENLCVKSDLKAEGDVTVCGLFGTVKSATNLSLKDNEIELLTDNGIFYGIAKRVIDGKIKSASITGVSLTASPLAKTQSELELYGLCESIATVQDSAISSSQFEIGYFDLFRFGGLAEAFTSSVSGCSLSFALISSAKSAEIGGVAVEGNGSIIDTSIGTVGSPLAFTIKGETALGGVLAQSENVIMSNGGAYVSLSLNLPEESESKFGGCFAEVLYGKSVSLSNFLSNLTVTRTGSGSALLGGVAAYSRGALIGGKSIVDITTESRSDVVGGAVAEMQGCTLVNCSVTGTIRAEGSAGGLFGNAVSGEADGVMTGVTIVSSLGSVGGLFSSASEHFSLSNAASLSRLTNKGCGLFCSAKDVSLNNCYFAGSAKEYALAQSASDCTVTNLFLDASLYGLTDLSVLGNDCTCLEGYALRSFGYGYTSQELGARWTVSAECYPYITDVGYPIDSPAPNTRVLDACVLTGTTNLYEVLPRLYEGIPASITWMTASPLLTIEKGMATVKDNGSGVLLGVLSGGAVAYRVPFTASGFSLKGEGTELSPYLIEDMDYFHYISAYPNAYFKLTIEGDEVENEAFEALFTQETPFGGHLDFNGVRLLSPTIGEAGILGYIDGGSVTGLCLEGGEYEGVLLALSVQNAVIENVLLDNVTFAGECALIGNAVNARIDNITVRAQSTQALSFAVLEQMSGGSVTALSVALTLNTADDAAVYVMKQSASVNVTAAQMLLTVKTAGTLSCAFTQSDEGSVFTSCMVLTDAVVNSADESVVAGGAIQANATRFVNSAFLLRLENGECYLVKEGTATYQNVGVFAPQATLSPTEGVTAWTVSNLLSSLSSMDGYVAGDLSTPLGYDLFGENEDADLYVDQDALILYESAALDSLLVISADKPFASIVNYTFTGDFAVINGNVLRILSAGEDGVLTLTNLYGESVNVSVSVPEYSGLSGEGSESDPYLISSAEEFMRIPLFDESGVWFLLTDDISVTIEEEDWFALMGHLKGNGSVTLTATLVADSLFTYIGGSMENVDIVLQKQTLAVEEQGGILAESLDGGSLKNCTVTISCESVSVAQNAKFGMLVGELSSGAVLEDVTLVLHDCTITAQGDAMVGLLAATAQSAYISRISVQTTGEITLTGSGDVTFGTIGVFTAAESTYFEAVEVGDPIERYYADGITLDLTLSASSNNLILGGFAGYANVSVNDLTALVNLTVGGGDITVGGVIGEMYATLTGCVLSAGSRIVTAENAPAVSGSFGGLCGVLYQEIVNCTVDVEMDIETTGNANIGGAVGYGSGDLSALRVRANVKASCSAEADLSAIQEQERDYKVLLAVGGAAGCLYGNADNVRVNVIRVAAESAYGATDLYVLSGGLAGQLGSAQNVEITGTGSVSASGGRALAAGAVALLSSDISCAVVSQVTLSASNVGGVVGVLSTGESGSASLVVCNVDVPAGQGGLIWLLAEDATVSASRYYADAVLAGGVSSAQEAQFDQVSKLGTAAEVYAEFDGTVWTVDGESIPMLK